MLLKLGPKTTGITRKNVKIELRKQRIRKENRIRDEVENRRKERG